VWHTCFVNPYAAGYSTDILFTAAFAVYLRTRQIADPARVVESPYAN